MIEITETVKIDFQPQLRGTDGNIRIQATIGDLRRALAAVDQFGDLGEVLFHVGADEQGYDALTIEFRNGDGAKAVTKPKPVTRRTTVKP